MIFNLIADDFVKDGDDIWFFSSDENGIYNANILTGNVRFVCSVPGEFGFNSRLYRSCVRAGNEIYFFPCNSNNIAVFNMENESIETIELGKSQIDRYYWHLPSITRFWKALKVGKYIYAGGMSYKGILRVDPETRELVNIDSWVDRVEDIIDKTNDEVYIYDMKEDGNYIYCTLCCTDAILKVDIVNESVEIINTHTGNRGYSFIDKWKDFFVLMPRKEEDIILWDEKTGNVERIAIEYSRLFNEELHEYLPPFSSRILYEDKLFLFRVFSDHSYIADLLEKRTRIFRDVNYDKMVVHVAKQYDEKSIIFIDSVARRWHIYNLESREDTSFFFEIDDERKQARWDEKKHLIEGRMKGVVAENSDLDLDDLLIFLTYEG